MCNCFCNIEKEVLSSSIQPPPRVPKISPKNCLMCPAYISMKVLKIWSWFYLREVHGSVSIFFSMIPECFFFSILQLLVLFFSIIFECWVVQWGWPTEKAVFLEPLNGHRCTQIIRRRLHRTSGRYTYFPFLIICEKLMSA